MYKLAIVLRLLRKRKITFFPIAGVALGVMALVVVLSIMEGFDTDFRARIRGMMPDMTLTFLNFGGFTPPEGVTVDDLVKRLEAVPEVRAVSPFISGLALASVQVPNADDPSYADVYSPYVEFKGFDFARENAVTNLDKYLKYEGNPFAGHEYGVEGAVPAFIVGSRIGKRLHPDERTRDVDWGVVDNGDAADVITFSPDYSRSRLTGIVTDVVSSGIYDLDAHTLYMSLEWAGSLRNIDPENVSGVGIALTSYDPGSVAAAKAHIAAALDGLVPPGLYSLETWEEQRGIFLTAIAMERRIMAFILFFFLVIAGFSTSSILIMIVLEKVRDIGILRAMGASSSGVAGLFMLYGVVLGLLGAAAGLAAGVVFVDNIDAVESFIYQQTGWQPFPPNLYELPAIPRILNWGTNLGIVAAALFVSLTASIIPSLRAAWLDPVEAIRYE